MTEPVAERKPLGGGGTEPPTMYFWHGVLWVNDLGEHAFFDVKKQVSPETGATLSTTDVPPLLIRPDDKLHVMILLENITGLQTVRYKIAEAALLGSHVRHLYFEVCPLTSSR